MAWEASHLAGQAAIRTDDAATAKALLVTARSLRSAADTGSDTEGSLTPGGLSDREAEVGQLVLEGLTYKDIGATLYISPKTVEHHVAHIRRKLVGAGTARSEFLAALRKDLAAVH
jgi:DNA-binding NarL/FixJ family response regulator